jgi:antitoxin component of MazEF toxin-antitoxin module
MFAIPKAILDCLDLKPDTRVGLSVADGRLIVDPHPRQKGYTVAELMTECDAAAPLTAEDRVWLEAVPTGREAM